MVGVFSVNRSKSGKRSAVVLPPYCSISIELSELFIYRVNIVIDFAFSHSSFWINHLLSLITLISMG